MLVNIDGVTKTLSNPRTTASPAWVTWQEMGDVNGSMRPVASHRLPWHGLEPGAMIKTNGHKYEILTVR
jgi:hypothetical protein